MPGVHKDRKATVAENKTASGPATASDHPTTWKFDFPIYHSWRKASRRDPVPYSDLSRRPSPSAGSMVNILDDERGLQLMTPRKPKSSWTRLNR